MHSNVMDDLRETAGSGPVSNPTESHSEISQHGGELDKNTCYVCGRKLGWTSRRRRHTCRKCRNKVCNDCSRKRRMIEIRIGQANQDDSDNDGDDIDDARNENDNTSSSRLSKSNKNKKSKVNHHRKNNSNESNHDPDASNEAKLHSSGVASQAAQGAQGAQDGGINNNNNNNNNNNTGGSGAGGNKDNHDTTVESGNKGGASGTQQVIYRLERVCDTCCKNNERNVLIKERLRDLRLKFNKHNKGTYVVKVDRNSKEYCQMGLINYCKIVEIDGQNCEQLSSHAIAHKLNTNPLPFTITLDYSDAERTPAEFDKLKYETNKKYEKMKSQHNHELNEQIQNRQRTQGQVQVNTGSGAMMMPPQLPQMASVPPSMSANINTMPPLNHMQSAGLPYGMNMPPPPMMPFNARPIVNAYGMVPMSHAQPNNNNNNDLQNGYHSSGSDSGNGESPERNESQSLSKSHSQSNSNSQSTTQVSQTKANSKGNNEKDNNSKLNNKTGNEKDNKNDNVMNGSHQLRGPSKSESQDIDKIIDNEEQAKDDAKKSNVESAASVALHRQRSNSTPLSPHVSGAAGTAGTAGSATRGASKENDDNVNDVHLTKSLQLIDFDKDDLNNNIKNGEINNKPQLKLTSTASAQPPPSTNTNTEKNDKNDSKKAKRKPMTPTSAILHKNDFDKKDNQTVISPYVSELNGPSNDASDIPLSNSPNKPKLIVKQSARTKSSEADDKGTRSSNRSKHRCHGSKHHSHRASLVHGHATQHNQSQNQNQYQQHATQQQQQQQQQAAAYMQFPYQSQMYTNQYNPYMYGQTQLPPYYPYPMMTPSYNPNNNDKNYVMAMDPMRQFSVVFDQRPFGLKLQLRNGYKYMKEKLAQYSKLEKMRLDSSGVHEIESDTDNNELSQVILGNPESIWGWFSVAPHIRVPIGSRLLAINFEWIYKDNEEKVSNLIRHSKLPTMLIFEAPMGYPIEKLQTLGSDSHIPQVDDFSDLYLKRMQYERMRKIQHLQIANEILFGGEFSNNNVCNNDVSNDNNENRNTVGKSENILSSQPCGVVDGKEKNRGDASSSLLPASNDKNNIVTKKSFKEMKLKMKSKLKSATRASLYRLKNKSEEFGIIRWLIKNEKGFEWWIMDGGWCIIVIFVLSLFLSEYDSLYDIIYWFSPMLAAILTFLFVNIPPHVFIIYFVKLAHWFMKKHLNKDKSDILSKSSVSLSGGSSMSNMANMAAAVTSGSGVGVGADTGISGISGFTGFTGFDDLDISKFGDSEVEEFIQFKRWKHHFCKEIEEATNNSHIDLYEDLYDTTRGVYASYPPFVDVPNMKSRDSFVTSGQSSVATEEDNKNKNYHGDSHKLEKDDNKESGNGVNGVNGVNGHFDEMKNDDNDNDNDISGQAQPQSDNDIEATMEALDEALDLLSGGESANGEDYKKDEIVDNWREVVVHENGQETRYGGYSPCTSTMLKVRGPMYLTDGKKIASKEGLFKLAHFDIFKSEETIYHTCKHPYSWFYKNKYKLPKHLFFWIVHMRIESLKTSIVQYFYIDKREFDSTFKNGFNAYNKEMNKKNEFIYNGRGYFKVGESSFDDSGLLYNFINGTCQFRNDRLKILARKHVGPMVVYIPNKPGIIGRQMPIRYYRCYDGKNVYKYNVLKISTQSDAYPKYDFNVLNSSGVWNDENINNHGEKPCNCGQCEWHNNEGKYPEYLEMEMTPEINSMVRGVVKLAYPCAKSLEVELHWTLEGQINNIELPERILAGIRFKRIDLNNVEELD